MFQFLPCLLLRPCHQPNTQRYQRRDHRCEDAGCHEPISYVIVSLRDGYDTINNNTASLLPHREKSIDIPTCIVDQFVPKSDYGTTATTLPTHKTHPSTHIQNILITTKAPDATSVVRSVLRQLHPTKLNNIVVMTNGVLAVLDELK